MVARHRRQARRPPPASLSRLTNLLKLTESQPSGQADDAVAAANMTLIRASAQVMAATPDIGVRADRIETVLSMAKLGEVKVTDNVVDQAAVKAALEAVIK